jgi:membrane protein DedA with SNARE-associated domain
LLAHLTKLLIDWGPFGVLLLSILDSSGVPVAGAFDALLILIAIERPEIAWWCAGIAVLGSSVGNVILFSVSRRGGRQLQAKPVEERRAKRFRAWFLRYGLLTIFIPAMIPIPLPMKLFVITAGVLGTPMAEFLAVVASARTIRYFGEVWLGVKLGRESTGFLKEHAWQFGGSAVALFAFIYGLMVWRHRTAPPEV